MTRAQVTRGLGDDIPPRPSVVTIGFFDGVHRGHQAIIDRAARHASERHLRSVVVTFDRHPTEVVRPDAAPRYLQSLDRRVEHLAERDVDLVLVLPFTREFAELPPEVFVETVLAGALQARHVVVGANFRFGRRAAGDVTTLIELGARHGFTAEAAPLVDLDGPPVSSTAIREAVGRGDVAWARRALGHPFVIEGRVVRGDGRGRSIGVPTANVELDERMQLPAPGVYAGRASLAREGGDSEESGGWPCVVNVGTRPTFDGTTVTCEAHLLDVDLDLYDQHLAVAFEQRLRDELRFDGPAELVAQIRRDIADARGRL